MIMIIRQLNENNHCQDSNETDNYAEKLTRKLFDICIAVYQRLTIRIF